MTDVNLIQLTEHGDPLGVANGVVEVTPSDTDYIDYPGTNPQFTGRKLVCRAFRVYDTAGDVTVLTAKGETVTYHAVAVGTVIEQKFVKVMATDTDAVGIEAIW